MKKCVLMWAVMLAFTGYVAGGVTADESDETCVCTLSDGMEKLPQVSYQVGKESACCEQSAEALAKKSGEPIQFVVADKTYDDKSEAMVALADETESFVNKFATPSTCKVSGKTSIAGQSISCSEKAAAVAKVIDEAMKSVSLAYQVGDEKCSCPNQAKSLAKEKGEPTKFVVGEECTGCPIDARIKLARAKYKAALEALAHMNKEETKPVSTSS